MSRNKQRKGNLNHSEYTIEDGHGGMKRNDMSAGSKIKVKDTKAGIDAKGALEKNKGKKDEPKKEEKQESSIEEGDSGWQKIGAAGADMVKTYQKKKAAKAEAE